MTVTSATAPYADAPGSEDPGTATLHAAPAGRKHLIRAEILKIRTTNTWWLFGIALVVVTGLALTSNGFNHHYELYPHFDGGGRHDHESQAQMLAMRDAARSPAGLKMIAADMVTSGQFFGVLFALLLGALVVTNEFYHQTATATFMTSPRRTSVIAAKLVAATSFGVLFWLITTVISLVVTPIFMHSQHVAVSLDNWVVTRSVLLNLLAYVMWAILGLGLGTLIRSQIGTVVTGMAVYFIGFAAVEVIFHLLYNLYPHNWILAMPVIAPSVAALVMTTPGHAFDNAPAQWVGLLVMIGYTLIFGGIGVWLTRRRDIS